jgi:putative ABC transport system permease protein
MNLHYNTCLQLYSLYNDIKNLIHKNIYFQPQDQMKAFGLAKAKLHRSEIAQSESKMTQGESEIAQGQSKLAQAHSEMTQGQRKLAQGHSEMTQGQRKVAQGHAQMIQSQSKTAQGHAEMARQHFNVTPLKSEMDN